MIHGIIFSMLDPNPAKIPLSTFLDVSNDLAHPSEVQMVKQMLKYVEMYRNVQHFTNKYKSKASGPADENDIELTRGLYLEALANSIDMALDPFRSRMLILEKKYIRNEHLPLSYFIIEMKEFESFFQFLEQFINELKSQRLHGCALLSLLHKHNFHADSKSMQAIKTIRLGVYAVFLRQLSQWLIYGRLVDVHEEFFIVHSDMSKSKYADAGSGMVTTANTIASETASTNLSLWQFQIAYGMIPNDFTTSWAEKVLFIGQTVHMLIDNPKKASKKVSIWSDEDDQSIEIGSLWNKQEYLFFNKIQMLYNCNNIDSGAYEHVVNEIKQYVTERLSEIAFNQADLMKHLKIFKEYFLLGRGELFLEFLTQLKSIQTVSSVSENLARDINQAFQKALNRISIDLDQITMHLAVDNISDDDVTQDFLKLIRLNFNVKWPLHLFFSPRVLERYNELFCFLLQIRHIQNELHLVWRLHRDTKLAGNTMVSQLRNRMLFLIDNLQYYLQVDVIESQFCALINAVQNSKDFEFIQRKHSVFQANVMELSFLLSAESAETANMLSTSNSMNRPTENPVLTILNKILTTIQSFCKFTELHSDNLSLEMEQLLELLEKQFSDPVQELLKLLSNRMAGPASEPLSQLLLRLDFNYWFSSSSN